MTPLLHSWESLVKIDILIGVMAANKNHHPLFNHYNHILKKIKIALGILTGRYAFTGPYRIIVDICNECGLGCIMCPAYSPLVYSNNQKQRAWEKEYISLDNFKLLLKDALSIGVRSFGICGGGEPFLHSDAFNMIEMVKSLGLECMMFTNGIHLNRKKIEFLSNIGLDRLILSLHAGDPIIYKKIHPEAENGYFEKIRDWLEYLKFLKEKASGALPKIWFRSVITSYNYDRVEQIINFCIKYRVDFIEFKIAGLPEGRMKEELLISEFQTQELITNLNICKKHLNIPNNIDSFTSTLIGKIGYEKNQNKVSKTPTRKKILCFTPWSGSSILANGTVLGCPYNPQKLGNINKERFSKIWYSPAYSNFRRNLDCFPCSAAARSRLLNYIHRFLFP